MRPARFVAVFFLRLAVFYALLMAPWPGLRGAYGTYFRACANVAYRYIGSDGVVRFLPLSPPTADGDTKMKLGNRETRAIRRVGIDSRRIGYTPTAFLIALILATPVVWTRRGKALVGGLILIHAYMILAVGVVLLKWFSADHPVALVEFTPFWRQMLLNAVQVLVFAPFTWVAVPTAVWILVTFTRDDWQKLTRKRSQ